MTDPIIEAAARAIYEYDSDRNSRRASWEGMRIAFPDYNDRQAIAVLAAVTPLILERAAKVAENYPATSVARQWAGENIAAAIRALKEQP